MYQKNKENKSNIIKNQIIYILAIKYGIFDIPNCTNAAKIKWIS